jgi:hypothetical protein
VRWRSSGLASQVLSGCVLGLGLGLVALGPGLRRGFLLSYDMVFVPREPFQAALPGLAPPRAVPSDLVVAAVSRVLPADVVQKIVLLAIFVLGCAGVARLLAGRPAMARLAGGVYYAWNPYVAERLIIGQWALLLGYAGLPWVLHAVTRPDPPSWRGVGRLALAMVPAIVGGFAAMTVTALVVVPAAAGTRDLRRAGAAVGVLVAGCLPWLIPSLLHAVYADPAGVAAFAARADAPFGSVGSLLMLGGMWNAQAVPKAYGGAWSVLWLLAVAAALAGFVLLGRRDGRAGRPDGRGRPGGPDPDRDRGAGDPAAGPPAWYAPLAIAAAAGLVLACLGVTAPGRDLLRSAISGWPGLAVLRDGQQFVAPLALVEACGAGVIVALGKQAGSFGKNGVDLAGVVGLLVPVLLLPGLAWGAAGRLRPVWYPAGWLAAARTVDASPRAGAVLLLPWETDRRPAWNNGETMLDPWPRLLGRRVIWNDGTRVGDIEMAPDDPRARRLDAAVRGGGPLTSALLAAGVRFVVDDAGPAGDRLPGAVVLVRAPGLVVYLLPG